MKKIISPVLFCIIFIVIVIIAGSCKKEPDWSDIIPKDTTKTNLPKYSGWSFSGNSTPYAGCIDTAYYSKIDTVILLNVAMSDSFGNVVRITLNEPSGKFAKGAYSTSNQKATIVVLTPMGNYTTTDVTTAFTVEITTINDTLLEAVYAASLINPLNNENFNISNGKIRALIGESNKCSETITDSVAVFTLQSAGVLCGNTTLAGDYVVGTKLDATNSLTLNVNVASRGTYNMSTIKVNGIFFSGSGSFANKGLQTITLEGSGTPLVSGIDSIPITAGGTSCKFAIKVGSLLGLPTASFNATPDLCDSAKVFGQYAMLNNLDSTNRIRIKVTVSSPGNYAINTSTVNGMRFSGMGTFSGTGVRTVMLYGIGAPSAIGLNNVPITIRKTSCTVPIVVDTATGITIPLNSWVCSQGTKIFGGPINLSSFGGDIITGKSLLVVGNTLGSSDTTMQLYVQLPFDATTLVPGIYATEPSTFSDNTSEFNLKKGDLFSVNKIYYTKSAAGAGVPVSMEIRILTYDASKKIVRGSFSGSVWNKNGNVVDITNGLFRCEVR